MSLLTEIFRLSHHNKIQQVRRGVTQLWLLFIKKTVYQKNSHCTTCQFFRSASISNDQNMRFGKVFFFGPKKALAMYGLAGTIHNKRLSMPVRIFIKGIGSITISITDNTTQFLRTWMSSRRLSCCE